MTRQIETITMLLFRKNGARGTLARKSEAIVIPYTAASQKSFSDRGGSYW
jgi:hypothetical protein